MAESNYDILEVRDGATARELQEAFRRLALKHHSDRGGSPEEFKRVRRAYEDLRRGKKYPDTDAERRRASRVYSGGDEEEIRRRNRILAAEVAREMGLAQEWAAALARGGSTGTRLFGSKALGEAEFERKANGALSIKGNLMAGSLRYDGPVTMQGSVTSPSSGEHATEIALGRGDFRMVGPTENGYRVENGARITAERGDIIVGNVFGRKDRVQDPEGRVGLQVTVERRTALSAPRGRIVADNAASTVSLEADTVMVLNMEDDVRVRARDVLIYGNKLTHDVSVELLRGGSVRFFDRHSVLGFSDDAVISLEGGGSFHLHDLKVRRIDDLPVAPPAAGGGFGRGDTLVGKGFPITYGLLEGLGRGAARGRGGWRGRLGLGRG